MRIPALGTIALDSGTALAVAELPADRREEWSERAFSLLGSMEAIARQMRGEISQIMKPPTNCRSTPESFFTLTRDRPLPESPRTSS